MQPMTIESERITLPFEVVQQLKGKKIEFIPYQKGFIMQPVSDSIREARGFLKKSRFSTQRYFQMKQEEKELEK